MNPTIGRIVHVTFAGDSRCHPAIVYAVGSYENENEQTIRLRVLSERDLPEHIETPLASDGWHWPEGTHESRL